MHKILCKLSVKIYTYSVILHTISCANSYIRLHNCLNYVTYWEFYENLDYGKPIWKKFSYFPPLIPVKHRENTPVRSTGDRVLTEMGFCDIFSLLMASTKTRIKGKIPREDLVWWESSVALLFVYRFWAAGRKFPDGCARYSANEWRTCPQPGWNRGVHYYSIVSHPWLCQGWVFILASSAEIREEA